MAGVRHRCACIVLRGIHNSGYSMSTIRVEVYSQMEPRFLPDLEQSLSPSLPHPRQQIRVMADHFPLAAFAAKHRCGADRHGEFLSR